MDKYQGKNPIGYWPRWVQILLFCVLMSAVFSVFLYLSTAKTPKSSQDEVLEKLASIPIEKVDFASVSAKAELGEYYPMRNVAYGFVSMPYEGQQKNPVLGCAWYLVVLKNPLKQADITDLNNVQLWCDKLPAGEREAALYQAEKIYARIFKMPYPS